MLPRLASRSRSLAAFRMRSLGAAAAWTPAALTSLVTAPIISLARAQNRLFRDAAKTSLATADGDSVRVIVDPFTGVEWTSPSDSARATLKAGASGWYLDFDGVDDEYSISSTPTFTGVDHCVAVSIRPVTASMPVFTPLFFTAQNLNGFRLCTTVAPAPWGTWTGSAAAPANTTLTDVDASLVMNGGNFSYNGTADGTYPASAGGAGTTIALGVEPSFPTRRYVGRFYGAAICSASQSAANITRLHSYLQSLWP